MQKIPMSGWPPWCCVAAFVTKALELRGVKGLDRMELASALGTRVSAKDANPWDLPIAARDEELGVAVEVATRSIPEALSRYGGNLDFRHIPFCEIDLRMHDAVFKEGKERGCVVGVGYNHRMLTGRDGCVRHVARVIDTTGAEGVVMVDDYTSDEPATVTWGDLERAVYSVNDGFWIVGEKGHLSFKMAPIR